MKIGGIGGMGPSPMVDTLIEAERAPIRAAEQRRDQVTHVRDQFKSFDGMLSGLGKSLDGLKSSSAFSKMMVESSHPELLEGTIAAGAKAGVYELEVGGLAKAEKQLVFGFPDKDKSEVGFGFMRVGAGDLVKDVVIDPGSTLSDVAQKINDTNAGVKAMIIDTGDKSDPFRLLVSSLKTGEETVMELDPDTTFTDFKKISEPKDLSAKFEGVDIRRTSNKLEGLIEGVNLEAKRAEPGTKIQIEVKPDVVKTTDGIKDFVKQYNDIIGFAKSQSQVDPSSGKAGQLSGDSAIRSTVRKLQADLGSKTAGGALSLMDIGISTDPRSGNLQVDETKLKDALAKNYDGVTALFANTEGGPGLAQKLSDTVQGLRDRQSGAISTRIKSMEQTLKNQNQQIERQEERLAKKRSQLERTFASLDAKMASMQGTSEFMAARMGGAAVAQPAAAAKAPA